jgi:DinB superfamily
MNAVDILKYGQLTVLQTIDGFPESAWETPGACGVWSVKNIIAHLASYEHVLVDVLTTFLADGATTPYLARFTEPGGQFNDVEVGQRKERTVKEVLGELNDTHAQVMSLVAQIPAETLRRAGTLPWYGRTMPWMILLSIRTMGINASTAHRLPRSGIGCASISLHWHGRVL